MLRRLQLIEQKLDLPSSTFPDNMLSADSYPHTVLPRDSGTSSSTEEDEHNVAGLPDVRIALQTLVNRSSDQINEGWAPRVIEALWLS